MSNSRISISDVEKDLIVTGLQIRLCIIETGTTHYRAADAVAVNKTAARGQKVKINALGLDQMRLIIESENLIERIRKVESK